MPEPDEQFDPTEILCPGACVRVVRQSSDDAWSGTILPGTNGRLGIRLNERTERTLSSGDMVEVSTQRGGVICEFAALIREAVTDPAPGIVVSWPRHVEMRSLRRVPRADFETPAAYQWYATKSRTPRNPCIGRILNVSSGGAALMANGLNVDESLMRLRFEIPGYTVIDAECERRHCRRLPDGEQSGILGLQFIMIAAEERRALSQFVADALTRS